MTSTVMTPTAEELRAELEQARANRLHFGQLNLKANYFANGSGAVHSSVQYRMWDRQVQHLEQQLRALYPQEARALDLTKQRVDRIGTVLGSAIAAVLGGCLLGSVIAKPEVAAALGLTVGVPAAAVLLATSRKSHG